MVLAVVYYAWTPVRMWCCRRRVAGSVDAALEERLKRLEGNAQPVSFLFLPRCFITPCQLSTFYFLLPTSYLLLPIYRVFFQHIYERVMVPSTVVSFPDEVEVEEAMSPTESDSRTPVSSSDLHSASSDFFFFRCRPTPTLEVAATKSDSAPGKSSSFLLRLIFISSFSGPRSSGVLRRLVRLLRLRLDPYVSRLLPLVFL